MADFRLDTRNFLLNLTKDELVTRLMALQKHIADSRLKEDKYAVDAKSKNLKHLRKQKKVINWEEEKFRKV